MDVEAGRRVCLLAGRFDFDVRFEARLVAVGHLFPGMRVVDLGAEDAGVLPGVVVVQAEGVGRFALGGQREEGLGGGVGGAFFARYAA